MSDQPNETIDDAALTKPKKKRSEAQNAATKRMRTALEAKQFASGKLSTDEKKLRLQAIKEQLNGPRKEKTHVKEESESEPESEEEEILPPPVAPKKPLHKKSIKNEPKKQPKVVYETESESEEEVIVVKKRKKPKKKTIIYEEESEEEEEEPVKPVKKERETKTQQNASSKFKVTPAVVEKPKSIYYFAD
jgi:hypothetical protein